MTGTLPEELGNLKKLSRLDLSNNFFEGAIPASIADLPALAVLKLSNNDLNSTIPPRLGINQPSLTVIDLTFNGLSGSIPDSITQATALTQLGLSNNALSGEIPRAIGNLTHLVTLQMQNNLLTGSIPDSIGELTSLNVLKLQENLLTGTWPESIVKMSSLTYLDVHENNLTGSLPQAIGNLSQLLFLDFSVNSMTGDLPDSIVHLTELQTWIFTQNFITGDFPEQLGQMSALSRLYANDNLMAKNASRQHAWANLTKLQLMDLSGWHVYGPVPEQLTLLPNIQQLKVTFCSFNGSFPPALALLPTLRLIDIGMNGLTGPLPSVFSPSLLAFDIGGNNMSGNVNVTSSTGKPLQLQALSIQKNNFSGPVPNVLAVAPDLQVFAVKNNNLVGAVPEELLAKRANGSLFFLASGNPLCLEGSTDPQLIAACVFDKVNDPYTAPAICNTTQCAPGLFPSPYLLAKNGTCFCINAFEVQLLLWSPLFVHASYQVRAKLEQVLAALLSVDVRQVLVTHIGQEGTLRDWNVRIQVFPAGYEPWNFVQASVLLSVLESNASNLGSFFGWNEIVAWDLTTLLQGEPGLTPSPPLPMPPSSPAPPPSGTALSAGSSSSSNTPLIVGVAAGLIALLILAAVVFFAWRRYREDDAVVVGKNVPSEKKAAEDNSDESSALTRDNSHQMSLDLQMRVQEHFVKPYALADLVAATGNWAPKNKLGEGGYGTVYLGNPPSAEAETGGVQWAVKRARNVSQVSLKAFEAEVSAISGMNHRNLVRLVGYCTEGQEHILVYEYVPKGTLHQWLHGSKGKKKPLSFRQRLEIAAGTAQALHYLHNFAKPPIVHRDVKSDNILIDAEMQAKVADFGLLKSINAGSTAMSTRVAGTRGYLDPEYTRTFKVTAKSDVYSFGVVLLELITGKLPVEEATASAPGTADSSAENATPRHLADWAKDQQQRSTPSHSIDSGSEADSIKSDLAATIADPRLKGDFPPEAMKAMMVVAGMCTQFKGRLRPDMAEVAYRLGSVLKTTYGVGEERVASAQGGEGPLLAEEPGVSSSKPSELLGYENYFTNSTPQ
eukprot:TRINITY_DN2464_c0_g3_i6.p1 TRINITY_DN2464_c0_g3~~TRINITY_DN2464_c0_g3_i6.p1  ORF type:complete len:1064 (-),score=244.57 TRINITY_DN2464_c0_g3_i6:2433-5624(-)